MKAQPGRKTSAAAPAGPSIPTFYTRPAGSNERGAWNVHDARGWIGEQRKPKKLSEVQP